MSSVALLGWIAVAGLWTRPAAAHPPLRPRVPVTWHEAPCIERFDRSTDGTMVSLHYAIPAEDNPEHRNFDEEVSDGRTHQFFAFCADPFFPYPPSWITEEDIAAAQALNLIAQNTTPRPLELDDRFPCWTAITTAEQRRPITYAAATDPIAWDVSTLEPGTYTPWAYTWDPPFSQWTPRSRTAIKIHDGDPDAAGPSIVVTSEELIVDLETDMEANIEGCVDAPQGSLLSVELAVLSTTDGEWTWAPALEDIEVEDDRFSIDLMSHLEPGTSAAVRITATDPTGRSSQAFLHAAIHTLPEPDCDSSSFIGSPRCEDASNNDPRSPNSDGVGKTPHADDPDAGGCAVHDEAPTPTGLILLSMLPLLRRRARLRRR